MTKKVLKSEKIYKIGREIFTKSELEDLWKQISKEIDKKTEKKKQQKRHCPECNDKMIPLHIRACEDCIAKMKDRSGI